MTSPLTEHPTSEQLQAFVLGTLSLDAVTAVEEHLADCLECQRSVEQSAADDPFVRQLVQADAIAQRQTSGPQDSEGTITLPIPSNPHNVPASGLPIGSTNRSQAGRPGFSRPEIDAEALRFRVDLMSGAGPSIEERLLNFAEEARSDLLRRLLIVEMEECLRANRPVPVDDYLQRFSDASLVERAYEQAVNRLAREAAAAQHLTEVFPKPFDAAGRFREYLFQSKIGEGGMGAVYKALHTRLERTVAFKVLTPDKMSSAEMISRFQREMKSVGKLEHPNIVRAHDAGDEQGCNFLVMEFVDGVPLDVLLKRRGPLPVREACEIIRQAAVGLDYAHRHGLVHRDVKPSNLMIAGVALRSSRSVPSLSSPSHARLPATVVMPLPVPPITPSTSELRVAAPNQPASLDTDSMIHNAVETLVIDGEGKSFEAKTVTMSRSSLDLDDPLAISQASAAPPAALSMREMAPMVKVLDLGLARLQSESHELTHESQVVGTLDYIAPEQARRGGNVDHRADIYSLGCTLFTLLAGRPPYGDAAHASIAQKVMAHVEEPLPSLSELRPDVPPRVLEVLQLMTDKQPARRYQSANAVADALAPFAQGANLRSLSDVGEGALAPPVVLGETHDSVIATGTTITLNGQPIRRRRLVAGAATILIVLMAAFFFRSKPAELVSQSNSPSPELPIPQVASATIDDAKPPLLSDSYEWSEPVNLGPGVNTEWWNDHPTVTADGLTLVFVKHPEGQSSQLCQSTRKDVGQPFGEAVRLFEDATSYNDYCPFLSHDGLTLWFHSTRPIAPNRVDQNVWVTRRRSRAEPFEKPQPLGPEINTTENEGNAFVSSDGRTLLFTRGFPEKFFQATRRSERDEFGNPHKLDVGFAGVWNGFPRLSADGRVLMFVANRGGQRIWRVTRDSVDAKFGAPTQLDETVNVGQVSGSFLSADEKTLYFSSTRPGGFGGRDLWSSTRVKKGTRPAEPPKSDLTPPHSEALLPQEIAELGVNALGPKVAADGLSLWFHAPEDRDTGGGRLILWETWRHAPNEPFTKPVPAEESLNNQPDHNLTDATLSADRLVLSFCRTKVEAGSNSDLWLSTRPSGDASWSAPVSAGAGVNSKHGEWEPELSPNGLELFFHSSRLNENGGTDLWVSRRANREAEFGPAENLGPEINSTDHEGGAALSWDGLTLMFHRFSPNGVSLWQATRKSLDAPFEAPQRVTIPLPANAQFISVSLSGSGEELYGMYRTKDRTVIAMLRLKPAVAENNFALRVSPGVYVEVPSLKLDPAAPHTMEAWVTPHSASHTDKHVVGWTGPSSLFVSRAELNWSFGLSHNGGPFQFLAAPKPVVIDRRVHLAAVRTGREFRLFVDGQRVGSEQEIESPLKNPSLPFSLSSRTHPFSGDYDEVRVSRVARYDENFTPQPRLEPDADTLALYHCDENGGEQLLDSSGNQHHGKIIGKARWIGVGNAAANADAPKPAVAPFGVKQAREHQEAWAKHLGMTVETINGVGMKMIVIPPGEFLMGAPDADADATPQEKPQHRVHLTKPFAIGATEVTVGQFRKFVEATKYVTEAERDGQGAFDVGSKNRRPNYVWHKLSEVGLENADDYPVRCVSWEDARQFCDWLGKAEGREYRLPTDAEWEFACRAGTTTRYSFGNEFDPTQVSGTNGSQLSPVAQFPANPFGLFDMHGNLNEICWDSNRTFTADSIIDPVGSLDPSSPAVVRGGAVSSSPARLRSSQRYINDSRRAPEANFATFVKGFRVVLRIEPK